MNPFAKAPAANPFAAPAGGAPNPFAATPAAAPNPFAKTPAPAGNPFAAAPGGAPNPFATPPAGTNNPFAKTAPSNPFGSPAGGAAPAAGGAVNPFVMSGASGAVGGLGMAGSGGVVGSYLMQYDNVYNADHPECKFREFVYNLCTQGQSEQATQRERLLITNRGGACKDSQWLVAKRDNPDPSRMYPQPIHFQVGMKKRTEKQKEAIEHWHKALDNVLNKVLELASLQDRNAQRVKKLKLDELLIERKLLAALARAEGLRLRGEPLGQDKHSVLDRGLALRQVLHAPDRFAQRLRALEPVLLHRGLTQAHGQGLAQLGSGLSPQQLDSWGKYLQQMEAAIARLQSTVHGDLQSIEAWVARLPRGANIVHR